MRDLTMGVLAVAALLFLTIIINCFAFYVLTSRINALEAKQTQLEQDVRQNAASLSAIIGLNPKQKGVGP